MKKPIYHAVKFSSWGNPEIVAVTTERGDHWWGRELRSDTGTHGCKRDLHGRFDTVEEAKAKQSALNEVRSHFSAEMSKIERARGQLQQARDALMAQVASGKPKRHAARLVATVTVEDADRPKAPSAPPELYEIVYGKMSAAELEWSGSRQGPGFGPHGSGNDGTDYPACPVCGGLEKPNGNFRADAVGHRPDCRLAEALGRPLSEEQRDLAAGVDLGPV